MVSSYKTSLLVLLLALGASPLAMAQTTPPAAQSDSSMHAFQDPQANAPAAQSKPSSGPKPGDRNCIQSTGSLIPAKSGSCLPVPGRSYSRDDLQRTGSPTLGPALRQLDPSMTVSGGH
ncbi:hypothetical protein [Dyella sp. ASV21]|uniref:hypothetical protein n=1 Tax=Dyella sp. ASV21 TaxID=2795114 RepID=UPI0018ECF37C|nr:hypothetical protein [Dyella sp. ASV21]